jgi:hypothetical protein
VKSIIKAADAIVTVKEVRNIASFFKTYEKLIAKLSIKHTKELCLEFALNMSEQKENIGTTNSQREANNSVYQARLLFLEIGVELIPKLSAWNIEANSLDETEQTNINKPSQEQIEARNTENREYLNAVIRMREFIRWIVAFQSLGYNFTPIQLKAHYELYESSNKIEYNNEAEYKFISKIIDGSNIVYPSLHPISTRELDRLMCLLIIFHDYDKAMGIYFTAMNTMKLFQNPDIGLQLIIDYIERGWRRVLNKESDNNILIDLFTKALHTLKQNRLINS